MSFRCNKITSKRFPDNNFNGNMVPENSHKIICKPLTCERTFLFSLKASLTLEAAVVLPVFLFFSVCILHFLILLSLQTDIQTHMDEAAREISKRLYITDDSVTLSLVNSNYFTIRSAIIDDDLSNRLENSRVANGAQGLSTLLSSYDDNSGILDITVTYTYNFPFLPGSFGSLKIMQRSRTRAWIGEELSSSAGEVSGDETDSQIVYITPTGTAYHLTASCSYLDLSIHSVSADGIDELRNLSGGKYYRCSCVVSGTSSVYVTDYGTQYHSDLSCSDLKRTVQAVDISEVGGRHLCSKCAASQSN